jgi:hypothetical protein
MGFHWAEGLTQMKMICRDTRPKVRELPNPPGTELDDAAVAA